MRRPVAHIAHIAFLTFVLTSCGESATVDGGPSSDAEVSIDSGPTPDGDMEDDGPLLGVVEVLEITNPFQHYSHAHGGFLSSPTELLRFVFYANITVVHWQQETMRDGDCRLLEIPVAFCSNCADGLCLAEELCVAFPAMVGAGDLVLTGLTEPVTVEPDGGGQHGYGSWFPPGTDLFDDDATVTLSAAGGIVPAFEVSAGGVVPLVAQIVNDEIEIEDASDFTLTWTPADPGSRVRLKLNANNHGHGLPYQAVIECSADDSTGQITIPKELIAAFPPTWRWEICAGSDCPMSQLTRYRRGTVTVNGAAVHFDVGSELQFWVIHD